MKHLFRAVILFDKHCSRKMLVYVLLRLAEKPAVHIFSQASCNAEKCRLGYTRNDGHRAIQGHLRTPILASIGSRYATSYS